MSNQELAPTQGMLTIAHNNSSSMFFDVAKFEHAQRVALMLTKSTLIPDHFRTNIGNCMIALNYAERIKADPFMVMQNMYVVHGRPGIEGKLVIALVNQCGRFEPLQFREDDNGCVAFALEIRSGKVLDGPKVDWELVRAEGWDKDKGAQKSKWQTMPQIMFRYRAATFFARTYCPEVLLGMQTTEEIRDVTTTPIEGIDVTHTHQQLEISENANQETIDIEPELQPDTPPVDTPPVKTSADEKEQPIIFLTCPVAIDRKRPRKPITVCNNCKNKMQCDPYAGYQVSTSIQDQTEDDPPAPDRIPLGL